jgi:hypothetical protein
VLVVALLAGAGRLQAQGGPPLRTDDPGTPGPGHWEVNVAVTGETFLGRSGYEAPLVDLNYGVGDRLQLKVEAAARLDDEPGRLDAGLGNPLVGVKWRFAEDERRGFALSTYPQLELVSPARTALDKAERAGDALLLPLEGTVHWAGLDWNAEVGYLVAAHVAPDAIYGLAVGRGVSERLELAAECRGEGDTSLRERAVVCSLGAREAVAAGYTLLGAVGTAAGGPRDDRPHVAFYLGLQSVW